MKIVGYLITVLTLCQSVFAQTGSISGQVLERKGNTALPFAKVDIQEYPYDYITDFDGRFRFDSLPAETYQIRITANDGRDTLLPPVVLGEGANIRLEITYFKPCPYSVEQRICPVCHKRKHVIPIVYGFPSPGMMKQAEAGKVKVGGCIVSGCDPLWFCKTDEKAF